LAGAGAGCLGVAVLGDAAAGGESVEAVVVTAGPS